MGVSACGGRSHRVGLAERPDTAASRRGRAARTGRLAGRGGHGRSRADPALLRNDQLPTGSFHDVGPMSLEDRALNSAC